MGLQDLQGGEGTGWEEKRGWDRKKREKGIRDKRRGEGEKG